MFCGCASSVQAFFVLSFLSFLFFFFFSFFLSPNLFLCLFSMCKVQARLVGLGIVPGLWNGPEDGIRDLRFKPCCASRRVILLLRIV